MRNVVGYDSETLSYRHNVAAVDAPRATCDHRRASFQSHLLNAVFTCRANSP
jgi:hypothetical protein